mgnify:CR=1 FL=1
MILVVYNDVSLLQSRTVGEGRVFDSSLLHCRVIAIISENSE